MAPNRRELVNVPGAGHVDLDDRVNLISFDTLTTFFQGEPEVIQVPRLPGRTKENRMDRVAFINQGGHDGLSLIGLPVHRAPVGLHHRHLGETGPYERIVGVTCKLEDRL